MLLFVLLLLLLHGDAVDGSVCSIVINNVCVAAVVAVGVVCGVVEYGVVRCVSCGGVCGNIGVDGAGIVVVAIGVVVVCVVVQHTLVPPRWCS